MVHRSGGVDNLQSGARPSHFGSVVESYKDYLAPLLTTGKDLGKRVVPQFQPLNEIGWYLIEGKSESSLFLEFDLTLNDASGYCFNKETTYELWHAEDLSDDTEWDNGGTAYTDIYICPENN